MARLVDFTRRTALLDRVVVYLGEHGLGDASFRPMAKALDVSVNALVHHFGTKDDLVAAALRRSGEVQLQIERQWWDDRPDMTVTEWVRAWWEWTISSREHLALVRLGIEAVTLGHLGDEQRRAERGQQIEFWRASFERGLVAAGLPPEVAAEEATLVKAVFTGLVVDLIASGDISRVNRSFERFVANLEQVVAGPADPLAAVSKN